VAEETDFQFYYDGELVDAGIMDARDLAPALLALADLIDSANKEVSGGSSNVSLRVHSDFKNKCFEVNLSVVVGYYRQFVDMFTAPEAQAWAALCSVIGISGFGLLQLIKKSKGRKPTRVVAIQHTQKVSIEFDGDDPIEVDERVFRLFQNSAARNAAAKIVAPLERDGYEELGIKYRGEKVLKVNKEEAPYFRALEEYEDEIVSESPAYVKIITPSFKEGNKWRVHDGDSIKSVDILDEDFLLRVRTRDELFGNNDYMRVVMRTKQWREGEKIKVTHAIVKVLKHETIPKNGQLDFGENKS